MAASVSLNKSFQYHNSYFIVHIYHNDFKMLKFYECFSDIIDTLRKWIPI